MNLIDRFKEPSTWAAITGILAVVITVVPDGFWAALNIALASVAAVAAVFLKEKSADKVE